jgi:hypothetical protein
MEKNPDEIKKIPGAGGWIGLFHAGSQLCSGGITVRKLYPKGIKYGTLPCPGYSII